LGLSDKFRGQSTICTCSVFHNHRPVEQSAQFLTNGSRHRIVTATRSSWHNKGQWPFIGSQQRQSHASSKAKKNKRFSHHGLLFKKTIEAFLSTQSRNSDGIDRRNSPAKKEPLSRQIALQGFKLGETDSRHG
jgi:hypothetical protein